MTESAAEARRSEAAPRAADGIVLTPTQKRGRRARNIAIGLCLGLFALFFYVVTIFKLGPGVLNRPL